MTDQSEAPSRRVVLAALAPLVLAACDEQRPAPRPAIYASLAAPGARVNLVYAASLINDYRRTLGLAPLQVDPGLVGFAEREAQSLAAADRIDASRANPLARRLQGAGVTATGALESVSAGYHTVSDAFSGWRGATIHDSVLRNPRASRLGLATAYNGQSKYRVFWVLVTAG